ncbi:DUF6311 domain-containing protein [Lichenicoccus sp.]|uniref:DUF6311 domain-containing protein n=1 Tax=Lichenicoccus sp. TaxID=2781899 RepID=UPI003D0CAA86
MWVRFPPGPPFPSARNAAAAYLTALLVGVLLVADVFPGWALAGALPAGAPPRPDFGKDVIGQLYYFSQPWPSFSPPHLSRLLIDTRLEHGASIAFSDSIPLLAVLAKLLHPILPPFAQTITLYQAAVWTLQPVAAVFALRGTGERRWLAALAVALIAASMPTFLFRLWHAALDGHVFLLAMLGLYLRIVSGRSWALCCACVLQVALLLIHPYLMLMASGLFAAAPLTLLLRRDLRWIRTLAACIASSAVVLLVGQLLGYWRGVSDGGFGYYSMNLAAPFWPTFSALIPGVRFAPIDATGGQADGYQYLGLGLLALIAVSLAGWSMWWGALYRHAGLALACAALCALAVTNWVFVFHFRLVHLPFASGLLAQMRASGRLFWPVAYSLMIAASVITLHRFPRAGPALLLLAALLQVVDAGELRAIDRADFIQPKPYGFAASRLAAILGAHRRLTMLPTFPCNGDGIPANVDPLWLAARTRLSINSIYQARTTHAQDCLPTEALRAPPAMDEVRLILPGFWQLRTALPDPAQDCRVLAPYIVCTRHADLLAGLPPPPPTQLVPLARLLTIRPGTPGAQTLLAGWTPPGAGGGAWSIATNAWLGAKLAKPPAGAVRVHVSALAMPVLHGWSRTSPRPVSVWAGTRHIGDWLVGPGFADYDAVVPADCIGPDGTIVLALRTPALTSALELGLRPDPRPFGILLRAISFNPAP